MREFGATTDRSLIYHWDQSTGMLYTRDTGPQYLPVTLTSTISYTQLTDWGGSCNSGRAYFSPNAYCSNAFSSIQGNLNNGYGTIEVLVRNAATTSGSGLCSWGTTAVVSTPFFLLQSQSNTTGAMRIYVGGSFRTTYTPPGIQSYVHVVLTWSPNGSNSDWQSYYNGSLVDNLTNVARSNAASNTNIYMGSGYNGYLSGSFGYLKIYDRHFHRKEVMDMAATARYDGMDLSRYLPFGGRRYRDSQWRGINDYV